MNSASPEFCQPVEGPSGEWVCAECGWGKGKGIHNHFYRKCGPTPMQLLREGQIAPAVKSRNPPPLHYQVWNLAKSLAAFVVDSFKLVTEEEYEARLEICDTCEYRQGTRCLQCGCNLTLKAQGRAFECPKDKWPKLLDEKKGIK